MTDKLTTYLVGGAVRDALLGQQVTDRDWVVVGSTPEQMVKSGFKAVGKDFPVFLHPKSKEEYALARTERKTAKGYQGFQFNTSPDITLEQDLKRRDITINAIAQDENGSIIDPFNGQKDLENKVIRHVSEAFNEDPVRVLRVARFAARFNFTIADETMNLMRGMTSNGEVDALVAERVWAETEKALKTDYPHQYFAVLRECGALEKVFPEIDALFGVPQPVEHHPEIDTGVHTIMVLEQAARLTDDPVVRFAALTHDLGKALTPNEILPSHHGHERAGLEPLKELCLRLRVPKDYQSLASAVCEYHLHLHKIQELKPRTILKVFEKTHCFRSDNRAKDIALACKADARGRTGYEDIEYEQAQLFVDLFNAANDINSAEIAKQYDSGEDIKQAISKARAYAIKQMKK